MYTLDASVWVNGFDRTEPGAKTTRQLLELFADQGLPIIIPTLALIEVAGSISRTRRQPTKAVAFAATISRLPHVTVVSLTSDLAETATKLAAQHALRGADAVYAAVALTAGSILVTLDGEHLTRLVGVVQTVTPAAILELLLR